MDQHQIYWVHPSRKFYNNETGLIENLTEKPLTEFSESIDELIQDLEQKLADAKRFRNTILPPNASAEENNKIAGK